MAFKNLFYQPGNIILGVGGNFDSAKMLKKIAATWGTLANHRTPQPEPAEPHGAKPQRTPSIKVKYKDTKQAHLALGFKSFPQNDARNPAAGLLAAILGSSMSSRLFVKIREEQGLAYYVYSANNLYRDTGSLTVAAGLHVAKADMALREILAELKKIKHEPVGADELRKAKDYIRGKVALHLEGVHEQLDWAIDRLATHGKVDQPSAYLAKIEAVTAAQVQAVAREIFDARRMSLSIVGPYRNSTKFEKLLKV